MSGCSIQLSYAAIVFILLRQDLNLKPSRPYVGMLYSVELRSHCYLFQSVRIQFPKTFPTVWSGCSIQLSYAAIVIYFKASGFKPKTFPTCMVGMLYSVELRSHCIYFIASGFKPEMLYSVELRSHF
jgi:hypothetical protein